MFRWYALGENGGEYAERIRRAASSLGMAEDFVMLGTTENPYKYMNECDIYFQPSRHEGKTIAVEEAKILCRPILATDYRTAHEQLAGGEIGMICDISEKGIEAAMRKMLSDATLRASFSEKLGKIKRNRDVETEICNLTD